MVGSSMRERSMAYCMGPDRAAKPSVAVAAAPTLELVVVAVDGARTSCPVALSKKRVEEVFTRRWRTAVSSPPAEVDCSTVLSITHSTSPEPSRSLICRFGT